MTKKRYHGIDLHASKLVMHYDKRMKPMLSKQKGCDLLGPDNFLSEKTISGMIQVVFSAENDHHRCTDAG